MRLIKSIKALERDCFQEAEHAVLPKSLLPALMRVWFQPRIASEDMLFGSIL
jgi:hypothetical protein